MKKVTFSDNVEVREMSIDRAEHVSEIKNPKNFIVSTPPKPTSSKVKNIETQSNPSFFSKHSKWIYLVVVVILCIVAYFIWKKYQTKSVN